jgi:hypothetical protein
VKELVTRSSGPTIKKATLVSYRIALIASSLSIAFAVASSRLPAQQVADTLFSANVGSPVYKQGTGPTLLIDEGHLNFHTMAGRYLAFARLLQKDGYVVKPHRGTFTKTSLSGSKILVISNALAQENEDDWNLPTPSAFDSSEVAVVRNWVKDGGSLMLIADHMPFPGAARLLAAEFGILMGNGFALEAGTENGRMRFTRSDGSLADHPITRGRNASERVDSVIAFTGQAFRLAGTGSALMTLGPNIELLMPQVAWQLSKLTPSIAASGMLQGAVVPFGRGRVVAFGEAAMFSAQLSGPNRMPAGMNDPTAPQNAQFLLNVIHWLDGVL